jgi:UDP-N-acetylglucosamine--N-acetylmuramyl-(pentapeptide) pyrophosphoryl-undecaprenol N-acetylglucosamine transferase
MRLLIAAGGTGGHIYPGISIAQVLAEQGAEVMFVGTKRGMESDVVPRAGFPIQTISARAIPRKVSLEVPKALLTAIKGTWEAGAVIRAFKPDVVLGTGGYVSGPALLMAATMRYPTVIHEQNAYPGITNRALARLVTQIAVGYPEAAAYFPKHKTAVTGNPVRPDIRNYPREEGYRVLHLDPCKRTLLLTGGSQGARSINQALLAATSSFHQHADLQVLHAAGKAHYGSMRAELAARGIQEDKERGELFYGNIRIVPYVYNIPAALAVADIVVGRGGALSSAEITVRGIPAILVPYPYSAEGHQIANARVLESHGAARVILDDQLNGETLYRNVMEILDNPTLLKRMRTASRRLGRPQATQELAQLVKTVAGEC